MKFLKCNEKFGNKCYNMKKTNCATGVARMEVK